MWRKIKLTLEMIKFEHSIFALPFAFIGAFLAARGLPSARQLLLILLAMVSARSVAMAFNRLVDRDIDAKNPRTQKRHLPQGLISPTWVKGFIVFWTVVFFISTYLLNPLVFYLSPIALIIITGYSYTKRFTWMSHLILGIADGLAPLGGWLAVKPHFSATPLWLAGAVALWVAGFDVLYSLLDYEFDKRHGLHSIPAKFGIKPALYISALMHLVTIFCFYMAGRTAHLGLVYFLGLGIIAILLLIEHLLVKPNDLSKINMAFFSLNGLVAIFMFLVVAAALFL